MAYFYQKKFGDQCEHKAKAIRKCTILIVKPAPEPLTMQIVGMVLPAIETSARPRFYL